ncbi:MAG: cytochrome C [Geobacter sp.]|nr:MAG: cytochrome C [Geobacter sp.]
MITTSLDHKQHRNPGIALAVTVGIMLCVGNSYAAFLGDGTKPFHNGGTGECDGCHATRAAENGAIGKKTGRVNLLGSDASSTCLRCHETPEGFHHDEPYRIATSSIELSDGAPRQFTPGGDFSWLKKNYRWVGEGRQGEFSPGERHGHNIVAADYGYTADSRLTTAPGGSFPSKVLSCISCHDPHGNYRRSNEGTISNTGKPIIASGSYNNSPVPDASGTVGVYRMLAGKGYQGAPGIEFTTDPPAAVAPSSYNREEASTDTRVAYGSGMSEWCSNCHGSIHDAGTGNASQHPSGKQARLSAEATYNYNAYLSSGNLNGSAATAYSSLVPFEMGTDDYTVLKATANSNGSNRSGATMDSNVMCLSCHRAHASGWDSMMRWNANATFIVYNGNYPGTDNGAPAAVAQGRTSSEAKAAMYGRKASAFAMYQRSFCNKCHAKD